MESRQIAVSQSVNEIFAPLWEQKARYYILIGGRGAGRSTAGSQYILSRLLAPQFFRCAMMRAIHSDIRNTIWQELKDRITEQKIGEILHITDNEMGVEYGANSVRAHGFRQAGISYTAKLKSLANYNTVLIEEASEVGEKEFMTLDDTLRTVKGDIIIILLLNPPPKNHWIIQRWFETVESEVKGFYTLKLKENSDAVYIGGNYRDNIANLDDHTIRRYKAYKQLKPDYYWQAIEGLVPEVTRGKIYNGWQQIDEVPKEARLVRFGEDYGWLPDPACVVAIYYWNGGYVIDELAYGTELSNEFLAGKIKEVSTEVITIADSAEPKSIDEQKTKYGLKVEGCEKGKDSVSYGIKVVSEKKIFVTKRSKNVWESYENFAWEEDKDGNPTGDPEPTYKHAMDAIAYPIVSLQTKKGATVKVSGPVWKSYGRTEKPSSIYKPSKVTVNYPGSKPHIDFPKGW